MKKKFILVSLLTSAAMLLSACGGNEPAKTEAAQTAETASVVYEMGELAGEPSDYSNADNWLMIPDITKEADTIYFYPTAYNDPSEGAALVCDIDSEMMRAGAVPMLERNASAFYKSTNVFAPYYRQLNLAKISGDFEKLMAENVTRTDVYASLDYYFENYNEGRPFILAGHSQGSQVVRLVLKDYMQAHPEYYERMIAAYVLGYSVTQDDLDTHSYLKFAEGETDTGVIVSWNIEGEGNGDSVLVLDGAISINPINWKRDDTYAPASENLGDHVFDRETGEYTEHTPGLADARVDTERGVVVCTKVDGLKYISEAAAGGGAIAAMFGEKSFHNGDYDFYFRNIEENVEKRVNAYLKK